MDPQPPSDRATWLDRLAACAILLGIGVGLVRVSLTNYGAITAPAVGFMLLAATLITRAKVGPGFARTMLTMLGAGLAIICVVFLLALVALLVALDHRGE